MLQEVEALFTTGSPPDPEQLYRLLIQLYNSQFSKTSFFTAERTINDCVTSNCIEPRGVASAIQIDRYTKLKSADSTSKYLTILEESLAQDSSGFLQRVYHNGLGNLANFRGDYFEAVVNYTAALQLTGVTDTYNLFVLHNNLAIMYLNMEFLERVTYHTNEAIGLIGLDNIPDFFYNTVANLYSKTGEYEKAAELYAKAVAFAIDNNKPAMLAQSYGNFGNLQRKQKQFEDALILLDKSDSLCIQLGIDIGLLINTINRAEVYFDRQEYMQAKQEIEQAKALLESFDLPFLNLDYYELLYRIFDSMGNQPMADRNFRIYTEIKEQKLGDLPRSIIVEWERSVAQEKLTQTSAMLALTLEREVRNKYLFGLLFFLVLFGVSVTYFVISRRRLLEKGRSEREEQQLRYQLELKSKELLTDTIHRMNLQQHNKQVSQKLQAILSDLPAQEKRRFSPLLKQLKTSSGSEFLEEFELRFTGVHEQFTKTLLQKAPDLTPNELRICAFIRLNITSKDIARITNRNLGTVDNARSSIRKKLDLDVDTNLQQYLMSI